MEFSVKFNAAIPLILKHEGGYVNDPADAGGETKYGISKRTYPNVDIKNLTVDQAKAIYYKDWWMTGPYESLSYSALATKVFDTAINVGASRAYKFLQEAANAVGAKLVVDGAIGPKSIAAINSLDGAAVLAQFRREQEDFYLQLIERKPSQIKFKKGWITRARS